MAKKTEPSILFYNRNLRFQKRSLRLQEQRLRLQITFNVSRLYKKEEGVLFDTPSIVWPCFCASCVPVCQSPLRRVCHLRLSLASMMPAASAAAAVAMSVAGVAVRVFTSDDDACLCSTSILTVSWRVCHRSTVLDRHRVTVSPMTTTTESLTLTLSAMATVVSLSAVCAVVVAVVRCVAHDAAVMTASAAMAVTAWRIRVRRRSTGIPLSIRRV